jgi:hypothetical protein
MQSLGIKFPFVEINNGGVVGITKITSESIHSNLVAFLTTKRRHRVMNNALYSPLYDYIMEAWDEISEDSLTKELNEKIAEFFPEIIVDDIKYVFEEENNLLHVSFYYSIIDLKIKDKVFISLSIQP